MRDVTDHATGIIRHNGSIFLMKNKLLVGLSFLAVLISGCSTVEKGKRYGTTELASLKTAYVVFAPDADRKVGMHIQEALADRGIEVTAGTMQEKPKGVGFYVNYMDHRQCDMGMYLDSLDIQFLDGATGKLIASGAFRNSWLHSFPNTRRKTFEVIDSMYKAR